ncbi:UNVERIFIED_CONTAM: hypothetical protein HDU68_003492, partial [Siphonaria sp. JEL0065]
MLSSILRPISSASALAPVSTLNGMFGIVSRRGYADVKAAKTGQKKKDTRDDDAGAALGPFAPLPASPKLAVASRFAAPKFAKIGAATKLNFGQSGARLLRSLDAELCARHDFDNRTALFDPANQDRIEPGSIVLVDQLSSRSAPRKLSFAGVLLNIKRRGILSTITVRNYVLGTGVEVVYPIYSPMQRRRSSQLPAREAQQLSIVVWFCRGTRKAAKTGQKKKDTRDDDAGAALGPFAPLPASPKLAVASRFAAPKFAKIGAATKLNFGQSGARLLRSLDAELCARHDFDNRTALFDPANQDRIEPGSIVLVDQLSSRSAPRKLSFAGVLLNIKRRGILSTITVRNYVLGTGVEVVYPIYSPMVTRIKVLKRVKPGFSNGADQVNYLREKPSSSPLSFGS